MRDKILDLFLDIFSFLRPFASVIHESHPLDQYLIVFYERVHPAEGGFERREPVGRLFRDIEEDLYAVRDPLLLRWETTKSQ